MGRQQWNHSGLNIRRLCLLKNQIWLQTVTEYNFTCALKCIMMAPFLKKKYVCFINYIFTRTPEQRIDLRRCTTSEVTIVSMFTITVIRTIIHIHWLSFESSHTGWRDGPSSNRVVRSPAPKKKINSLHTFSACQRPGMSVVYNHTLLHYWPNYLRSGLYKFPKKDHFKILGARRVT